jgi:PAS domain S-box-containing protein
MSVRIKTLIIICLTFLALLVILYFTSQWFLLQNAIVAEEKSTTRDVTRLLAALDDQIAVMDATVGDWAPWDDTYEFISSGDTVYIDSNLPNVTFTNLRVELMLFINNSGQIVFGKMVDLDSDAEIPVPEGLYSELQVGNRLLSHKDPSDKMAGILSLPEGAMIIASQPIVTSQGEGPIRGTLIMGRFLDETEIAKLSQKTQLSISSFPYNEDVLPNDVALARNSLVGVKPIFVAPQSETVVSGYTLVNDVYGNPALILRVDTPREAFTQAKVSIRYLGLALLAIGFVLGLVTMLLLERMVITRLTSLNSSVKKIGSQGTASSRVEAHGNDEIFVLATSVNSMLDSLENSRAKERESEERYKNLATISPVGIFCSDQNGATTYVNPMWCHISGLSIDEALGDGWLSAVHPEDKESLAKGWQETARLHKASFADYRFVRPDGTVAWVMGQAIPEMNSENQIVGYVGTITDITERKQAEEALRRSQEETAHANRLLLALSQAAQAVQRSRTPDEVYRAIQEQMSQLGNNVTVFELDTEKEGLRIAYLNYDSNLVRNVEKITGLSMHDYRIHPRQEGIYQRILAQGETVHVKDAAQAVADTLPKKLRLLARPSTELLHLGPSTFAPLTVDGKAIGILVVTGSDLAEADNPAITAFARQAAIAMQNARLYEQAQQEIAERKQVEETLRQSAADLKEAQRISRHGSWEWNTTTDTITWSEEYYRIYGVDPRQRPSGYEEHLNAYTPESAARLVAAVMQSRQTGEGYQLDLELARADGTRRWITARGEVKRDANGQIVGFCGTAQDITERKQAEEALVAERSLLRTLIDHLPNAIYVKDAACRKTLANPVDVRNMGASTEAEILGKTDFDVFPHDLAAAFYEDDQSVIRSGLPILNREEMITLPDGTMGWQVTSKVPVRDRAGQVIGLVGIGHDITERKRTEAVLRESEERFRSILDDIEHGYYYEVDTAGNFTFINSALVRMLGRPANELMGMNYRLYMTPEGGKAVFQTFNRVFRTGIPEQALEWDLVRPDGTLRYVEVSVSLIKAADGSINGFRGIVYDITEHKRAESQLTEQVEELQRWHNATLGRETRILDLKREVNELLGKVGKPPRYPSAET